jgi:signal transduction histidine kinase
VLRNRLLNSVAFRRAVIYVVVLGAVTTVVLGFLYHNASAVVGRQTESTIEAEVLGLAEQYRQFGLGQLVRVIEARSRGDPGRRSIYLLTDPTYQALAGNLSAWPREAFGDPGIVAFNVSREDGSETLAQRALARTFDLRGGFHLLVGRDMAEQAAIKSLILDSLLWAAGATGGLAVLGGLLLSRAILRRIDAITRGCEAILAGDLKRRMPVTPAQDEFDRLSHNLNIMLDRIEDLMVGMRDVADAIAHDLRSPISRLRARLERSLIEDATPEAMRTTIEDGLRQTDEILATFAAVLDISLAESGALREEFGEVDLAAAVTDVAELYEPVADEKGLVLAAETHGPLLVRGHRHLLCQSLANLIDNAIKYGETGGEIRVTARQSPAGPEVLVCDRGPGIPPNLCDKALQRFTRLDASRSKPGNGLGLALVAAVARLHRATLSLEDNAPGLRVRLTFGGESGWIPHAASHLGEGRGRGDGAAAAIAAKS